MVAASLALGAFQQRMAEQFGIEPGAEMRVAIKDAQAARLPVILIDREIGTTLKRIYHNVPWWKRIGLFAGLISSVVSKEKSVPKKLKNLRKEMFWKAHSRNLQKMKKTCSSRLSANVMSICPPA